MRCVRSLVSRESHKLLPFGLAGSNPATATIFYTLVADKQCSSLQNCLMWERYPPNVPFRGGSIIAVQ